VLFLSIPCLAVLPAFSKICATANDIHLSPLPDPSRGRVVGTHTPWFSTLFRVLNRRTLFNFFTIRYGVLPIKLPAFLHFSVPLLAHLLSLQLPHPPPSYPTLSGTVSGAATTQPAPFPLLRTPCTLLAGVPLLLSCFSIDRSFFPASDGIDIFSPDPRSRPSVSQDLTRVLLSSSPPQRRSCEKPGTFLPFFYISPFLWAKVQDPDVPMSLVNF